MRAALALLLIALACGEDAEAQAFGGAGSFAGGGAFGSGTALPCGDGAISGAEECDDGNGSSGDGCSAQCAVESGYECAGTPSVCAAPVFDFSPSSGSGLGNISAALTVNSTLMTTVLDCEARDVSGTNLVCDTGGSLAETGAGASPTAETRTVFTESGARAFVVTAGAKYYESADTGIADVTTSDLVVEAVVWTTYDGAGGDDTIIAKRDDGGTGNGWMLLQDTATSIMFLADSGATTVTATVGVTSTGWHHVLCFVNRDENSTSGAKCHANGAAGSGANWSTASGTWTTTDPVRVGGFASFGASNRYTGRIALARAWTCAGCIAAGAGGAAEILNTAKERAADLMGVLPVAAGTAIPSTMTRSTIATVPIYDSSDGNTYVHTVGGQWARVGRMREPWSTDVNTGLVSEPAHSNLLTQPRDFSNVAWTATNVGAPSSSAATTPNIPASAGYDIESTDAAGDVEHCISAAPTLSAAKTAISVFVKPGAVTGAFLDDSTIATAAAWFNTSTCKCTFREANADCFAEDYGDFCRISIVVTGTAAAHTIKICGATTMNDKSYDDGSNAAVDLTLWHAQVEAHAVMTTVIPPGVSVAADALLFVGNDGNAPTAGSIDAQVVLPGGPDVSHPLSNVIVEPYSAGNDVEVAIGSSNRGSVNIIVYSGGVQQAGLNDVTIQGISTGADAYLWTGYGLNAFSLIQNGYDVATDVSGSAPLAMTTIGVGSTAIGTRHSYGIVKRIRIWDTQTEVGRPTIRTAAAIGDSVTDGLGGLAYPERLEATITGMAHVSNLAVSGSVCSQQLAVQVPLLPTGVDVVWMMPGGNDIGGGATAADTYDCAQDIYTAARAAGAVTVCLTMAPRGGAAGWSAGDQTEADSYNALILADAGALCDHEVDVWTALEDPLTADNLRPEYDNGDKVHLSVRGQQAVADAVYLVTGAL